MRSANVFFPWFQTGTFFILKHIWSFVQKNNSVNIFDDLKDCLSNVFKMTKKF